jgi:hemerythrin-like domain-containing protein
VSELDVIERLLDEHADFMDALERLNTLIEGVETNGRGDYFEEEARSLLPRLTDEVEVHSRQEEEYLFPLLAQHLDGGGPLPTMIAEHEGIREAFQRFRTGLTAWLAGEDAACRDWVTAGRDLRGRFSLHMQKENLVLFPMARRLLSPAELEVLAEQMR